MTKRELIECLKKENVPTDAYCLEGGLPNDRYCVVKTNSGWEVYYSEMGKKYEAKGFASEEDAYDYLYVCLKKMMEYM
jgi:hypothetical protein